MNQPSDCTAGVTRLTTGLARTIIRADREISRGGGGEGFPRGDLEYFRKRKEGKFAVYISGRPSRIISRRPALRILRATRDGTNLLGLANTSRELIIHFQQVCPIVENICRESANVPKLFE